MTSVLNEIYEDLTSRYRRIDVSVMKSILQGELTVVQSNVNFLDDKNTTPCLGEVEDAFKKFNCAIFTAFRGGYTLEENQRRNARLKQDMELAGMTFRPVNGCYREAEWEYPCIEYCYFVYNDNSAENFNFFANVYRLAAKYDQDSFLYKRAGINRVAFLVATTDAGRLDLKGHIKLAGQLHMHVPDVEAWTDCSDGRFSFQLKGMVLVRTNDRKIKIGEGDIFDTSSYAPDGIAVLRHVSQEYMSRSFRNSSETIKYVQHVFKKSDYSETYIYNLIYRTLNDLRVNGCKRIGIHCSIKVNGSSIRGAAIVFEAIKSWVKRYSKKIDKIVIVDTFGEYCKVLD